MEGELPPEELGEELAEGELPPENAEGVPTTQGPPPEDGSGDQPSPGEEAGLSDKIQKEHQKDAVDRAKMLKTVDDVYRLMSCG